MIPASVGFQCPECVRAGNKNVRRATTVFGGRVSDDPGWVSKLLIGMNVVFYVLQVAVGPTVEHHLWLIGGPAFDPAIQQVVGVADGEYYRLLTAAFLHGSVIHLALNMYALYLFGPPLEAAFGRIRFAAVYFVSALGGSAASYAVSGPGQPSLGASGAIFGLLGAYLVVSRKLQRDTTMVLVLLLINFIYGFIVPRIDWRAHLGGLIAGSLCAAAIAYAPEQAADRLAGRRHRRDGAAPPSGSCCGAPPSCRPADEPAGTPWSSTRSGRRSAGARAGCPASHPVDLSAHVLDALVARTGLDPALVDDVVWGCVSQTGEQAVNVGRNAALAAGWPEDVVGVTLDRQCGSSQQAVHFAAAGVIAGQYDIAVAGGVESMSRVPMLCTVTQGPGEAVRAADAGPLRGGRRAGAAGGQRRDHRRAVGAVPPAAGRDRACARTPAPRPPPTRAPSTPSWHPVGDVPADEGIRPGQHPRDARPGCARSFREDGVVTAGNASQISDGAAALLVTTSEIAARHGWRPLARLHAFATAGVDPVTMLTAPIPATARVLERAGLTAGRHRRVRGQRGVRLGGRRLAGRDRRRPGRVNPRGGAIALGHPLGGSGARLMTTLVHHLAQTGGRWGLQTMCEGGGMANATVLERL